jgi:hypothetical protein
MSETEANVIETAPQSKKLAYGLGEAAQMLSISRTSLWREMKRRKLHVTSLGTIPHAELERYLRDEMQLAKRPRRFPRISSPTNNN